jgi:hypothetical protein
MLVFWRTPITKYRPKSADEDAITQIFLKYITSRNNHDKNRFLSTLHDDCKYMVTKDVIATKDELKTMLPELWMQNEDGNAAFGRCIAWECWHENYYEKVMLINPKFQILKDRAHVEFKIVSGIFMDDNYFDLVKENNGWLISQFSRPIQ